MAPRKRPALLHSRGMHAVIVDRGCSFLPCDQRSQPTPPFISIVTCSLGHLVICNAEISEADGNTRLLHQPVGQAYW